MSTPNVRELIKSSLLRIEELEARLAQRDAGESEPIAIIGLGCRLPGGDRPDAFYDALRGRLDAVQDATKGRFAGVSLPEDKPGTRWAGLLEKVDEFDAAFFGISAREATALDPQQR